MIEYIDVLGYIAAFLTTSAFVPQVHKIYKTKRTEDISLFMYIGFVLGVCLWLYYGILINALPIILANIFTFSLSSYILYMKFTESKRN